MGSLQHFRISGIVLIAVTLTVIIGISSPKYYVTAEKSNSFADEPVSGDIQPGNLTYFNFTRPEGVRFFYLYVPSNYNPANQYPLAIYFHGYGTGPPLQNGYHQGIFLNMTVDAEAAGYLIAFPQGTNSSSNYASWDAGRCCKGYNGTMMKVDDVAFTRIMVKTIQAAVTVNSQRIYATGWSNGGFFSERLACEAADIFAGIASDAGGVVIGQDNPSGQALCDAEFGQNSLDIIIFKGTSDQAVTWVGSAWLNATGFPSALDDLARWTSRLGCYDPSIIQPPQQTYNDGVFSNLVYKPCRGGTTLEWMTVRMGVHQWWTKWNSPGFVFETTAYVFQFFDNSFARRQRAKHRLPH